MPQRLAMLQARARGLLDDERSRAISAGIRRRATEPAFRRAFSLLVTSVALSILATALVLWVRRSMHFVGEEFFIDTAKTPIEPPAPAEEPAYEAEPEMIGSPGD